MAMVPDPSVGQISPVQQVSSDVLNQYQSMSRSVGGLPPDPETVALAAGLVIESTDAQDDHKGHWDPSHDLIPKIDFLS